MLKAKHKGEFYNIILSLALLAMFVIFSNISISSVKSLQGDARVINYTGFIRGATQRLVKQELNQVENDALIVRLDKILAGLAKGDEELRLVVMKYPLYQSYISDMQAGWEDVKRDIYNVRQGGEQRILFDRSETYFALCDKAVSAAEEYSDQKIHRSRIWQVFLIVFFAIFIVLFYVLERKQKRTMAELQAAESASREKSDFLSRMSHEIRTPMNGIIGMTEIARHSLQDAKRVEDCLDKIKLSSDYLLSLLNDILDMSRIESGKLELYNEVFDIRNFIQRIETMFTGKAKEAGVHFTVDTVKLTVPWVIGDELRLTQVIVNIISNAIKFTPEKGSVTVTVEEGPVKDNRVELVFKIADTGIGMTKEFQKKIFEPFKQAEAYIVRQYGGSGLGLSICGRLLDLMDGDMVIHSEPGNGAEFIIRLSLDAAQDMTNASPEKAGKENAGQVKAEMEAKAAPEDPALPLAGYTLILAEDNDLNAEIASVLLEEKGAVVKRARNGREALTLFLEEPKDTFQAILMDIQMPEMNGLEAVCAIRSADHPQGKTIPVIGLSANVFQQDVRQAMECGMNGYVAKPICMEELIRVIKSCLFETMCFPHLPR